MDVLDDDDGVVDHKADGQHEGEQRQEVDRVAKREEEDRHTHQRQRNGDNRNQGRAYIAEKQEDDDDDDDRRFAERLAHFPDRRIDEHGCIIGDARLKLRRQLALQVGKFGAHLRDHRQRVGVRRRGDAQEHRLQPVEGRCRIEVLRPEIDGRDLT